jgi:2-hydroxychromene-2-carboxylate isomerase
MARQAEVVRVPLRMPAGHPLRTVEALRALLIVGPPYMPLAHAFFRAYWVDGIDISTEEGLRKVLSGAGHDPDPILRRLQEPTIKDELRRRTDEAIAVGTFGVPTFVVDGELYWGQDRLPMIERRFGAGKPDPILAPRVSVDLYFDYSSPFSYIACARAEHLVGDEVRWKPMLLGAVFKAVGTANVPLFDQNDAKRAHSIADMRRQADDAGIPLRFPTRFPMKTVLPLRVTLQARAHESAQGRRLVHRIYRAYWAEDQDISSPSVVAQLCNECGLDGAALVHAASAPEGKKALFDHTDTAVAAGVFGAPTFVVHRPDGPQLFWGADRLELALRVAAQSTV